MEVKQCSAEKYRGSDYVDRSHRAVIVTRLLIRNGLYEAMANQEAYTAGWGRTAECTASTWQCVSSADLRSPFTVFLLVEGFQKTHNVKKYLGRMFLFATDFGGAI